MQTETPGVSATEPAMREVLRLTRLALLLQLLTSLLMLATSIRGPVGSLAQLALLLAALTLPSLALLGVTLRAERGPAPSARTAAALLAAMIGALVVEAVGASLIGALPASDAPPFFLPVQTLLLFLFIPALLGGWLHGRRHALGWSAAAIGAMLLATAGSLAALQLAPRPFGTPELRIPWEPLTIQAIMLTIICGFVGTLADRQRAEHAQLQLANRQLTEQAGVRERLAASHERLRLARDLHDLLAHTMAGVLVQLRATQALVATDPQAARDELAVAEEAARRGLVETREAIASMRGSQVQDLGLALALRQLLDQTAQRAGLAAQLQERGDLSGVGEAEAETLFLIAQEALRNVERHAAASQVLATLAAPGDGPAWLSIEDNGAGFDPARLGEGRFGLRGMRERAALIGAAVDVRSAPGGGTRVLVTLAGRAAPVSAAAGADLGVTAG